MEIDKMGNSNLEGLSAEEMAKLADFDAEISPDEIKSLEEAAATRERLHQHKLCLVALSSSAQMLKEIRRNSPAEFDAMLEMVDRFQDYAKSVADLSQRALYRMLVVGSLTDEELEN
ncbi:MAG: hypothetical protein QM739_18915 [Propionivibrio sp.]